MTTEKIREILNATDFIHTGGSEEELKVAEYLKGLCEELGVKAFIESFPIEMARIQEAELFADGQAVPCRGYLGCGNADLEGELVYIPNTDQAALAAAKGKIVLLDSGVRYWVYRDLLAAGAAGFITYDGNVHYPDNDIDQKELRSFVSEGKLIPGVNINAKDAFRLVRDGVRNVRIRITQHQYEGESRNVVAELPGTGDEWIILTAHYDTTPLSRGSYDNMTGCIGILGVLEALKNGAPHRYGIRLVFCGSEERGLRGSKAYAAAHENELEKIVLNVNLDMIGTVMGRFIACCSAEEGLMHYLRYMGAELGWGIAPRMGVYSSDSTPFADKGVPALSFARLAGSSQATIHNRYDTPAVLSPEQIRKDTEFIAEFTRRMADSAVCPVKREIPEKVKKELDEYLNRKRPEN